MPTGDAVGEVKERLDIVEVVSGYVRLKRQGRNYTGLCPFHAEKSPSFTVSGEKQVWYCFGCSEGGDLIRFVEKAEGLDFPQALELLAGRAGVELESFKSGSRRPRDRAGALAANRMAAQYYHHVLLNMAAGARALAYLRRRGVENETIADFELGYAPRSMRNDNLLRFLRRKGVSEDEAVRAGLALASRGPDGASPAIDRFRGRLVFPIRDEMGHVVGFGARALGNEPPKYMNSPQTAIYDKSRIIFGLSHAKKAITESGRALMVEGYFDVMLAHQFGIKIAIASSGTSITEEQLKISRRLGPDLLLCLDSDDAGRTATERAIELAARSGLRVRVLELPNAKDPGEFFLKTPQLWDQVEGASQAGWEWWLNRAFRGHDLRSVDGRAGAAAAAVSVLTRIPEEAALDIYCQYVGEKLRLDPARLLVDVQTRREPGARDRHLVVHAAIDGQTALPAPHRRSDGGPPPEEDELLGLLVAQPAAFNILDELSAEEPIGQTSFRDLCDRVRVVLERESGSTLERHLDAFDTTEQARLARVSLAVAAPEDEGALRAAISEAVDRIRLRDYEAAMSALEERLKEANEDGAQELLLEEHRLLARRRAVVKGQLFRGYR